MKYFIGFFSGLLLFYSITRLQEKFNIFHEINTRKYMPTQSHNHQIEFLLNLYNNPTIKEKETQSKIHILKNNIKVIIMDKQAYWIKDNVFYTADLLGNGVDKETTRTVDTMSMNKVQLDKMVFIIDQLREGNPDDFGSTRK